MSSTKEEGMFLDRRAIRFAYCDAYLLTFLFLFVVFDKTWSNDNMLVGVSSITASGARGGLFGAGGRFKGGTDPIMEKFNESMWFDKRMWAQDIRGSVAYAKAIGKVGIITDEEVQLLVKGLGDVHKEWEEGKFEIKPGDEGKFRLVVFSSFSVVFEFPLLR